VKLKTEDRGLRVEDGEDAAEMASRHIGAPARGRSNEHSSGVFKWVADKGSDRNAIKEVKGRQNEEKFIAYCRVLSPFIAFFGGVGEG
jgi:hypothetical protein